MEKVEGVISFGGDSGSARLRGMPGGDLKKIGDFRSQFVKMIKKELAGGESPVAVASEVVSGPGPPSAEDPVAGNGVSYWKVPLPEMKMKGGKTDFSVGQRATSALGLETSTFTICARVRPILDGESELDEENFECIFSAPSAASAITSEPCMVFKPKVSITGKPKLEKESFSFDKTFGQTSSNEDVYNTCRPTIARAIAGQVGTIFAFGQTGSGKTHTMNAVMDSLAADLFSENVTSITCGLAIEVSFSYMELLGQVAKDCLQEGGEPIQIGELLDSQIGVRNLSAHIARSKEEFLALISVAKSARSIAATERNSESSRSHGVGLVRVSYLLDGGAAGELNPGTLFIIDLAGSERLADKKNHSDARLEETKAINLSLMSLKECIRTRTLAATPGMGAEIHVPFRRSKLTLLMKDCFDISSSHICSTVVIAHVTPLARDLSHSLSTLNYAAPLKVAAVLANPKLEKDLRDPALWNREQTITWLEEIMRADVSEETILAIITALQPSSIVSAGSHLCQMPEVRLINAVQTAGGPFNLAKKIYNTLWTFICDAKMRRRRPNGTIITVEQEAAEIERIREATIAKAALWKEREVHLKSDF